MEERTDVPMEAGISLGANLGNRLAAVQAAVDALAAEPGARLTAVSPVYETDPVDVAARYADLPYLNAVVLLESPLSVPALAARLAAIETRLGRIRDDTDRNAPRVIDLDLIYFGGLEGDFGPIRLPHRRWAERRFVAQPLADLRPDLILPGQTRRVAAIAAALPPTPAARPFAGALRLPRP